MSTSPVSYCWAIAGTKPSELRLNRAAILGSRAMLPFNQPAPTLPPPPPAGESQVRGGDPRGVQVGVDPGLPDELRVRPPLHETAPVEHQHLVGVLRRREPVGDGDGGAAPGDALQRARQPD